MGREALILALHTSLLIAPLAVAGTGLRCLGEPRALCFLFLANLLCAAERQARGEWIETPRPSSESHAATATGLTLLGLFWVSLGTYASGGTLLSPRLATAGGALFLLGITLRWTAMRTLGPSFVSRAEVWSAHSLVRHGPYRLVRHPSETGLLLVSLGAAMLLGSGPGMVVFVTVMLPLTVVRIRGEERVLRREFGSAYLEYARCVKGLFPGLV